MTIIIVVIIILSIITHFCPCYKSWSRYRSIVWWRFFKGNNFRRFFVISLTQQTVVEQFIIWAAIWFYNLWHERARYLISTSSAVSPGETTGLQEGSILFRKPFFMLHNTQKMSSPTYQTSLEYILTLIARSSCILAKLLISSFVLSAMFLFLLGVSSGRDNGKIYS